MAHVAIIFSWLAAAGFMAIGGAALLRPAILSHLYGTYVHEPNGRAFVRAAGARDIAFGILTAAMTIASNAAGLQTALMCGALIAAADFLIVLRANRSVERIPLSGHLAGFVFLSAAATFVGMAHLAR